MHTNQLLSEKMQAMERAARAAPMQWHDPRTDPEVDEWTDDEALGYQQIEVSEELLMRGFRAAEARAEAAASAWERQQPRVLDTSKMGPGSGRDPIFEAFENPSRGAKGDVVETDKGAMADDESEEEDDECDDADEEDDEEEEADLNEIDDEPSSPTKGLKEAPAKVLTDRNGEGKTSDSSDEKAKPTGEATSSSSTTTMADESVEASPDAARDGDGAPRCGDGVGHVPTRRRQ